MIGTRVDFANEMYPRAIVPSRQQQKRGASTESVLKDVTWKFLANYLF